jgi:hypothetical protein
MYVRGYPGHPRDIRRGFPTVMETVLAIVVLIVILLVLAGLIYIWVRASGPGAARAWLVAPASLRQTVGSLLGGARDTEPPARRADRAVEETGPMVLEREPPPSVTLAYDETALATLRDDLERRLAEGAERQQELDRRLQRIDTVLTELRAAPDELGGMLRQRDRRVRRQVEQLRYELEGVRRGSTATGARLDEAVAELYTHLAQIEASLATAINPMLLPGEPLQVPEEFVPETLESETWDEVGEHAYAFGMAFNRTRLVLDPPLARDIEQFLATLRQALTGKVYPTVRRAEPSRAQLALMRTGLEGIVETLAPVRRQIEATWRQLDRPVPPDDDVDEDGDPDDDR